MRKCILLYLQHVSEVSSIFCSENYDMTMKEDVQPKKRSEKIIISISGETSEWLELYCKTDGILRKDFVSLPLDYFEHTGFDLQYIVLDYFPLEKIIGELCWVHNEQKTFGKIHVKTEL